MLMKVWFLTVGFVNLTGLGNNVAGEAADFGRSRVGNDVIDVRRNLSTGLWSAGILLFLDLHQVLRCHFKGCCEP